VFLQVVMLGFRVEVLVGEGLIVNLFGDEKLLNQASVGMLLNQVGEGVLELGGSILGDGLRLRV
jgi:hypothetical protein